MSPRFTREQADSLHFTAPSRHASDNSSPSFLSNSTIANIVGYTKNDIRTADESIQVFTLLSVPFAGVTDANIPAESLQFSGVCKGEGPQDCDFIQFWDGNGGFNSYYCYADDGLWYNTLTDELLTDDYAEGIPAGTPFWYVAEKAGERTGNAESTISGAVCNKGFVSYDLRTVDESIQVFTLLSNPYPASWMVGEGVCEITGVCKGDGPQECDFIQFWDGNGGFNSYYCYADDGLWYNTLTDELLSDDYSEGIPAATPFWYVAEKAGERTGDSKITFYKPAGL